MTQKEIINFLKLLKKKKLLSHEEICLILHDSDGDKIFHLLKREFIRYKIPQEYDDNGYIIKSKTDLFEINAAGEDYLEEIKRERIPVIISILALIVSGLSMSISFVALFR